MLPAKLSNWNHNPGLVWCRCGQDIVGDSVLQMTAMFGWFFEQDASVESRRGHSARWDQKRHSPGLEFEVSCPRRGRRRTHATVGFPAL